MMILIGVVMAMRMEIMGILIEVVVVVVVVRGMNMMMILIGVVMVLRMMSIIVV